MRGTGLEVGKTGGEGGGAGRVLGALFSPFTSSSGSKCQILATLCMTHHLRFFVNMP